MDIHTVSRALDLSSTWCIDNYLNLNAISPNDEPVLLEVLGKLNAGILRNIVEQCYKILQEWDRFFHNNIDIASRCLKIYNRYHLQGKFNKNNNNNNNNNNSNYILQRPLTQQANLIVEEMEVTKFLEDFAANSIIDLDTIPFKQDCLDQYNPHLIMKAQISSGVVFQEVEEPYEQDDYNNESFYVEEPVKSTKKSKKKRKHFKFTGKDNK